MRRKSQEHYQFWNPKFNNQFAYGATFKACKAVPR